MMIASIAKATGGPVARTLTRSAARLLMYHRFGEQGEARRLSVGLFEQHLDYIRRHFRPRRLCDVVADLHAGRPLADRTVVITIDDGYSDFVSHAYPLLQRYEMPATLFLATRFIDQDLWLWFDAVHYTLLHTPAIDVEVDVAGKSLRLDLRPSGARERAWSAVGERLMRVDTPRRARAISQLQAQLAVDLPARPTDAYAAMRWDEIARLDASLIEIGAHTCTHPVLSRCADQEIDDEVGASKLAIETRLGRRVDSFAYPHGEPGDYDERAVRAVAAAGFGAAVAAGGGPLRTPADLFALPRIPAAHDVEQFRSSINGLELLADNYRTWRAATF